MANSGTVHILGIETSCDDTSICLLQGDPHSGHSPAMHFFERFSHEQVLATWGGVVPEIAARNHLDKLVPLLRAAFRQCPAVTPGQLDAIAVTTHPGLLGPLLTGLNVAKTLALIHRLPSFPSTISTPTWKRSTSSKRFPIPIWGYW